MKKKLVGIVTTLIILLVITGSIFIMNHKKQEAPEEVAKCIGKNSVLYIQSGCHACKTQENLFGKNYELLNVIDCLEEQQECINIGIMGTPTWKINGELYKGVQEIERLKELTGC